MSKNTKDFALVVGINHYVGPGLKPLNGALEDAAEFQRWLLDERGGNLPVENCGVVLSEQATANADPIPIQRDVDRTLGRLIELAKRVQPARRLYVFFSGHGIASHSTTVDLCMADWSLLFRNAALASAKYVETLKDWGLFREIVFFLDCCRVRSINAEGIRPTLSAIRVGGNSRVFTAYATEFLNPAFEASLPPLDPDVAETSNVRGHFSRALMSALWGGAARPQGGVPASDLKKYLAVETSRIASENGVQQKPEINDGLDAAQEPIFGFAKPEDPVAISFAAERLGHEVVLEGPDLTVLREGRAEADAWKITLKPGTHILRDATNDAQLPIRFRPDGKVRPIHF